MEFMLLKYTEYLCNNALMSNMELLNIFNSYRSLNEPISTLNINHDDETMLHILLSIIKGEYIDISYENPNIKSLLEYINYTKKTYKKKNEEIFIGSKILEEFSDISLYDSRLIDFEIYNKQSICKLYFTNVLTYNRELRGTIEEAESANILFTFYNVSDIKFKGTFCVEHFEINKVYENYVHKNNGSSYNFNLLCIANYNYFIVNIICEKVVMSRFDI